MCAAPRISPAGAGPRFRGDSFKRRATSNAAPDHRPTAHDNQTRPLRDPPWRALRFNERRRAMSAKELPAVRVVTLDGRKAVYVPLVESTAQAGRCC
jgi:hypothetical protein